MDVHGSPGPLALVGGDEFKPGNEPQDLALIAAAGEGAAFVVATAAARQSPGRAVRTAQAWFAGLGLGVEELPATAEEDTRSVANAERAREGRFFYLVGGDPDLVPGLLAGTPVWDAIVSAWRGGAALAGSSAGAMGMTEWGLFPKGRGGVAPGLGLVPDTIVLPHFATFGEGWTARAERAAPEAVLCGLDERTAAVWQDGAWRAMGAGAVTVVRDGVRQRYRAGDRIAGIPQPSLRSP